MNVYPNPSLGHVSIALNKGDSQEKSFDMSVFNMTGQEVYAKKLFFQNEKEEIDFPDGIADGVYFIRLKDGNKNKFLTKKIILQRK